MTDNAIVTEIARAKVNLSLRVLGRRPDGYHALESLVAFADYGDVVRLTPGLERAVVVTGGGAITGANSVTRTLDGIAAEFPKLALGRIDIEKRLPIASGLGGGSANAAAAMRAIRRANPDGVIDEAEWFALALRLGADVPVCLADRAAWMTGIGEQLAPIADMPSLHAVLVNPMATVPDDKTARVFQALAADPLASGATPAVSAPPPPASPPPPPLGLTTFDEVLAHMAETGNTLEAPAERVVPEIGLVRAALAATLGVCHVALSGAGPTLFGVYRSAPEASAAQDVIASRNAGWWVVATQLS